MSSVNNDVASFYNLFSGSYTSYANGSAVLEEIIDLGSSIDSHSFSRSDWKTWEAIQSSIDTLVSEKKRREDKTPFTLLDVGCGDGVWAIRIANYCLSNNIAVDVDCVDLSDNMLQCAEFLFSTYCDSFEAMPDLRVTFKKCNIIDGLGGSHKGRRYDLTLCLHTVLNHVPREALDSCMRELVEHTSGFLYLSVKPPFSRPTFYAASMSEVIRYERRDDHLYALDLKGKFHVIPSSLISAEQLRELFRRYPIDYELVALDVVLSRFMPDPQWIGGDTNEMCVPMDSLLELEAKVSTDPALLDFANHILAVLDVRQDR
jgi:SAM-dependent methyltransferase